MASFSSADEGGAEAESLQEQLRKAHTSFDQREREWTSAMNEVRYIGAGRKAYGIGGWLVGRVLCVLDLSGAVPSAC